MVDVAAPHAGAADGPATRAGRIVPLGRRKGGRARVRPPRSPPAAGAVRLRCEHDQSRSGDPAYRRLQRRGAPQPAPRRRPSACSPTGRPRTSRSTTSRGRRGLPPARLPLLPRRQAAVVRGRPAHRGRRAGTLLRRAADRPARPSGSPAPWTATSRSSTSTTRGSAPCSSGGSVVETSRTTAIVDEVRRAAADQILVHLGADRPGPAAADDGPDVDHRGRGGLADLARRGQAARRPTSCATGWSTTSSRC